MRKLGGENYEPIICVKVDKKNFHKLEDLIPEEFYYHYTVGDDSYVVIILPGNNVREDSL